MLGLGLFLKSATRWCCRTGKLDCPAWLAMGSGACCNWSKVCQGHLDSMLVTGRWLPPKFVYLLERKLACIKLLDVNHEYWTVSSIILFQREVKVLCSSDECHARCVCGRGSRQVAGVYVGTDGAWEPHCSILELELKEHQSPIPSLVCVLFFLFWEYFFLW